jgi:hypothetical protein
MQRHSSTDKKHKSIGVVSISEVPSYSDVPDLSDDDRCDYANPCDYYDLNDDEPPPQTPPTEPQIFRWCRDWPTASMCEFHVARRLYYTEELFKLDQPYICPICGAVIEYALHPARLDYIDYRLRKTTFNEFCQTVTMVARQVGR